MAWEVSPLLLPLLLLTLSHLSPASSLRLAGPTSSLLLLTLSHLSPASSLRLAGFTCPSGRLDSPGVLEDKEKLSSVCADLSVMLGPLEDARDKVSSLLVEFSHVPLPNTGEKVFKTELGEDAMAVDVIKETGDTLPTLFSTACGSSYLVASIQNDKGEVAEFDGFRLMRPCQDTPALKLVIKKADNVNNELRKGTNNPFKAMGVNEITVENGKDRNDMPPTALYSRWAGDMPLVLAFFVPVEWGDADHLLSAVGFNISTMEWYNDDAKKVALLIDEGRKDLGMFDRATFLHKTSLLDVPSSGVTPKVEPGQKLGKVDLDKTSLSESFNQWSGFLVVALDPLDSINDDDRSDNYFVQFVNVNATREDGEWVGEEPVCSVSSWSSPKTNKFGKDALISYNSIYGEKQVLVYNGEKKGLRRSGGKKDNFATIINQVAAMDALNLMEKCDMTMLRRYTDSKTPITEKIVAMLQAFTEKFKSEKVATAGDDHDKVHKQLVLISEGARILFEDDKMMEMIEKEIKKKIKREKGDRPGPGGRPGHGGRPATGGGSFGGGGWNDPSYGGGDNGGWDNEEGSLHAGGWDDNSYGGGDDWSTEGPGDDWSNGGGDWSNGGGDWSNGGGGSGDTSFGAGGWNDWSTTDGWGSSDGSGWGTTDGWGGTDDWGATDGWGGTDGWGTTTQAPPNGITPSLDKLMAMDNIELMSSLQSMDVGYMKMLMTKHPNEIKERMKKLTPEELKEVMESIKPMMDGSAGGRPKRPPPRGRTTTPRGGSFGGGGRGSQSGGRGSQSGGRGGKDDMFGKGDKGPPMKPLGDRFGGGKSGGKGGKEDIFGGLDGTNGPLIKPLGDMFGGKGDTAAGWGDKFGGKGGLDKFGLDKIGFEKFGGKGGKDDISGGLGKFGLDKIGFEKFGGKEGKEDFGGWNTESLQDDELGELSGLFGDGEDEDEESTDWDAFFSRKKRQVGKEKDMEKVFEMMLSGDATVADKVEMAAAMGLTHVLMGLKEKDMREVPRPVAELPSCLKQIIWAPEESPRGKICSALPKDFRMKIRETMMMVLKKRGPRSLYGFSHWVEYGKKFEKLGKANMMMISLPVEADDLREKFIKPIQDLTKNLTTIKSGDKDQDESDAKALAILNAAFTALGNDEVLSALTEVVRDIQGAALMKSAWMVESGELGDAPKDEDVCQGFAGYVAAGRWREGPHAHLEVPTAWRQEEGVISRGDFCPLAARWYWTKVAMCGCATDTCGKSNK